MTLDEETLLLLQAYHDGELSPGETLAMERRLSADADLRAAAEELAALSSALKAALAQPAAPAGLRGRVVERLGFRDPPPSRSWQAPAWRRMAALLLVGLLGGAMIGGGTTALLMGGATDRTADSIVAGHLRALAAPQPFDLASSSRHVVKPWFNGRTTVAPTAPDLADQGFPLVGGRIDIVDGKAVPTLVYRHDPHVISVTVVPGPTSRAGGLLHRGGSTLDSWNAGDLTYWAVSDLDTDELRRFVNLMRSRTDPSPDPH